jgi:hypothetical protein
MRAFITGWLPSLLLNLWLAMVMPRLVYLIVQVWGKLFCSASACLFNLVGFQASCVAHHVSSASTCSLALSHISCRQLCLLMCRWRAAVSA